ncbi:hypothetical protein [Bradyrhizobium sp. BR 1432]|uniref:hypothetical protein n=1 Tax=Bradyrhizobium sp. BR 1432 TaxID=3447966 RepID=UPI003EE4594E
MTNLRSVLDKYLSMRKGLGYKYEHQTRRLADFVAFLEKQSQDHHDEAGNGMGNAAAGSSCIPGRCD